MHDAKGIDARSDETAQQAQPAGQEPGPKGSPETSLETTLRAALERANEPTAEELALAGRIATMQTLWPEGTGPWTIARNAALAAIRETTSLGCAWLESVATKRSDRMKAEAIRTNAHLKDIGHDA